MNRAPTIVAAACAARFNHPELGADVGCCSQTVISAAQRTCTSVIRAVRFPKGTHCVECANV